MHTYFGADKARQIGFPVAVKLACGVEVSLFGPLLAFGVGGTQVEIWKDLQYRLPPLTDQDAREMLSAIRGAALLTGYRGAPPVDREGLVDMLLRTSRLVESAPEIAELDEAA